jgi:hypothetical protein
MDDSRHTERLPTHANSFTLGDGWKYGSQRDAGVDVHEGLGLFLGNAWLDEDAAMMMRR